MCTGRWTQTDMTKLSLLEMLRTRLKLSVLRINYIYVILIVYIRFCPVQHTNNGVSNVNTVLCELRTDYFSIT